MRKAKIALIAIALFAVVGGAFAFKASRTIHVFYSSDPSNGQFSSTVQTTLTTVLIPIGVTVTTYLTSVPTTATTIPLATLKIVI